MWEDFFQRGSYDIEGRVKGAILGPDEDEIFLLLIKRRSRELDGSRAAEAWSFGVWSVRIWDFIDDLSFEKG